MRERKYSNILKSLSATQCKWLQCVDCLKKFYLDLIIMIKIKNILKFKL